MILRAESRVFAPFKHAGKPVKRGVGVRPTDRFVQRRDQVVVFVAGLVVLGRPPHQPLGQGLRTQRRVGLPGGDLLYEVQKRPPVAVRHFQKRLARLGLQRKGAAKFAFGPLGQTLQVGKRQALQDDNLRPAQKRCVQFE